MSEWFGEAWVDPLTGQILRVEAFHYPEHFKYLTAMKAQDTYEATRRPVAVAFEKVTTEFGLRQSGLRFPTKVTIEGLSITVPERAWKELADAHRDYTVTQVYSEYELFNVETKTRLRSAGSLDPSDQSGGSDPAP